MMTAHPWEEDGGLRRLAMNAHRLGIATEAHRRELYKMDVPPGILQPFDPSTPTISESYRLEVDGTQDKLPFADGPGVLPGYLEGAREFWTGKDDDGNYVPLDKQEPKQFWEIATCPVLVNWECVFVLESQCCLVWKTMV